MIQSVPDLEIKRRGRIKGGIKPVNQRVPNANEDA